MKHIFVADDEMNIRELITKYLEKEGYKVTPFSNGVSVALEAERQKPDLLVLDINMPGSDGLEICRQIRKNSEVPIIFVTARDEEIDRILGLELGGDDYLSKPFSPRELVVRIKNIFKRMDRSEISERPVAAGDLILESERRVIAAPAGDLKLTGKEYEFLEFMLRHPGQAFSREQFLEKVWGYDFPGELRAVDDLVKRLRKKMSDGGSSVQIETVWGYGYKLEQTKGSNRP